MDKGFIPEEFVESETAWFYNSLGIDDMYFKYESVDAISNHILSLYSGKVAAFSRTDKHLEIRLDQESEGELSAWEW
jgi:glutamate dehydrogenase